MRLRLKPIVLAAACTRLLAQMLPLLRRSQPKMIDRTIVKRMNSSDPHQGLG